MLCLLWPKFNTANRITPLQFKNKMTENNKITDEKIKLQAYLDRVADVEFYCQIHKITRQEFWRLHLWKE